MRILAVGRLKDKFYRDGCAEYEKRIRAYSAFSIVEVADEPAPVRLSPAQEEAVKEAEGAKLLKLLRPSETVVVLDVQGKHLSSEQLAAWIGEQRLSGKPDIAFLIGGSLGHGAEVLKRADARISLSAMTYPHALARLVLLEQLYRAEKILRGETYHK